MTSHRQTVLLASDDVALVDRLMPVLRRSDISVRRVLRAAGAQQTVREEWADLVVVAMSPRVTSAILESARAHGSVNARSALLAICEANGSSEQVAARANRVLAPDCSRAELQRAVSTLLHVAPRAEVRAPIRLRLGVGRPDSPPYSVDNLSASGMFVVGIDTLEVGSTFGFQLALPDDGRPILGQAEVVRVSDPQQEGVSGVGVSFVALGGDAPERVRALVDKRLSCEVPAVRAPSSGKTRAVPGPRAVADESPVPARASDRRAEPSGRKRELEDVTRHLDQVLCEGLYRRFKVVTWYVTGAELGLESLDAFYRILEAVYGGAGASAEKTRRLTDLKTVHRALSEFAKPKQTVKGRVRNMLAIRRPLERLLDELTETEQAGASGRVGQGGLVAQLVTEVVDLMRRRRDLVRLRRALVELQGLGYLLARKARRRRLDEVRRRYSRLGRAVGFDGPDALESRRQRAAALVAVGRELEHLERRLKAIHERVYQGRTRPTPEKVRREELAAEALHPVLADVLVEGQEYLVRAYSAFAHALEVTGSDPGLLERAARLAREVEADEPSPRPSAPAPIDSGHSAASG